MRVYTLLSLRLCQRELCVTFFPSFVMMPCLVYGTELEMGTLAGKKDNFYRRDSLFFFLAL
jgi:hypothetical protein